MAKKKKHRDGLWGLVLDKAEEAADVLTDGKLVDSNRDRDEEREQKNKDRSRRRGRDDDEERDEEIDELRDAIRELTTLVSKLDAASKNDGAAATGSAPPKAIEE